MLYSIDDAGIAKPLTIQQREALTKRFQRFPVIRYRLDYLSFSTQGNNDVKYKIEFTPRSDSDTPGSSMGFMFNPIKAKWGMGTRHQRRRQPSREAATPLHDDAPAPVDVIVEK